MPDDAWSGIHGGKVGPDLSLEIILLFQYTPQNQQLFSLNMGLKPPKESPDRMKNTMHFSGKNMLVSGRVSVQ